MPQSWNGVMEVFSKQSTLSSSTWTASYVHTYNKNYFYYFKTGASASYWHRINLRFYTTPHEWLTFFKSTIHGIPFLLLGGVSPKNLNSGENETLRWPRLSQFTLTLKASGHFYLVQALLGQSSPQGVWEGSWQTDMKYCLHFWSK